MARRRSTFDDTPFGKIPAFEHQGFHLYEAGPISRYVDETFAGPALQPSDARHRARGGRRAQPRQFEVGSVPRFGS